MLAERTVDGLHDFLVACVLPAHAEPGARAVDLGAGTGALALRLKALGLRVEAVDLCAAEFRADVPFAVIDLNEPNFAAALGEGRFDLVTAVEVIEHLECPIGFLRNVRRLLKPTGTAVLTTPNMDNAPSRVKFLLTGTLRTMDEQADSYHSFPHISPVFWDLLRRKYLPRARLRLADHHVFPAKSYALTRRRYAWMFTILACFFRGPMWFGDSHILVLQPNGEGHAAASRRYR